MPVFGMASESVTDAKTYHDPAKPSLPPCPTIIQLMDKMLKYFEES
jgi:hypothetical protein